MTTAPPLLAMIRSRLVRFARWLLPSTRRRIAAWEFREGLAFLQKLSIRPGSVVLDFGSGPGHYSVPAARVVGQRGLVCAVERGIFRRLRLAVRASVLGLPTLHVRSNLRTVPALLGGRKCSVILLYDVLHFMDASARRALYADLRAVLAADGILSVHPKHVRDNMPALHFQDMSVEDVAREIEEAGFTLRARLDCTVWHDLDIVPGIILNFELKGGDSTR